MSSKLEGSQVAINQGTSMTSNAEMSMLAEQLKENVLLDEGLSYKMMIMMTKMNRPSSEDDKLDEICSNEPCNNPNNFIFSPHNTSHSSAQSSPHSSVSATLKNQAKLIQFNSIYN